MENISIDKLKTALVVIDLQKGIAQRPISPYGSELIIKNAAMIADKFRENKMPVFLVHVTSSSDGKDSLRPITEIKMSVSAPSSDWAEIVPEMGPKQGDFIITKRQWGAFYGTELDLQLRRRGVETIVLCGISTDIGVESTARFAYEYGYNQIFIEDAMGAMSEEEHNFTVSKIFPRIGLVRKTEEILSSL